MPMKNMIGMQNAIGINVNPKELPVNTIGWRVMVVERDSINRTVNDSGIITGVQESLYKEQRTVDYAVYGIASQVAAKPDAVINRGNFRPSLTNSISDTVYATLCVKELAGEGIRTDYISIPCVFDLDAVDTQTAWYNQAEDKIIGTESDNVLQGRDIEREIDELTSDKQGAYWNKMHLEIYNSNIPWEQKLFLQNQLEYKHNGDFVALLTRSS